VRSTGRLWLTLGVLGLLSPLGLYAPEALQAGAAWGEWGLDELAAMLGYVPAGVAHGAGLWAAPLSGYALPGAPARPGGYVLSAFLGMAGCGAAAYALGRWLSRGRR